MATATLQRVQEFGPDAAGNPITSQEFDRAEFVEGWRYELIEGVLDVTPIPLEEERCPNDHLSFLLRSYRECHEHEGALNDTLPQHTIKTGRNRRRADRVIWAGLGRRPRRGDKPTIVIEFVSEGSRNLQRDYQTKRREFQKIRVREYWIVDRFQRTMTVYVFQNGKSQERVIREHQTYSTALLPGFELRLARLLALADSWADREADEE